MSGRRSESYYLILKFIFSNLFKLSLASAKGVVRQFKKSAQGY